MRWDPLEYGGLSSLQVPNTFLWKPDILLFNSADEKFDASFPVNFVVQHTGDILLSPPGIVRLSCRIDITWFPYDEQICFMKFGSWSYDGDKVDLQIDSKDLETPHNMDLSYFIKNGEWELLSTPAVRVASEFDGLKYVEVYYKLHMKRRTLYYGLNWLVPSFLITLTGLLGFTLSPECGEKITLQITNLLSVTVFLGMVSAITPPTSESIPVIAIFFSISMVLLGASIVVTIWIVNIFYRSRKTHEMSDMQRYVFLEWLPWFLMMSRPGSRFVKPQSEGSDSTSSTPLDSVIGTGPLSRRCNGEGDKERLLPDDVVERLARHESRGSYGVHPRLDRTFSISESDGGSSRCAIKLESVVKECLARLNSFQEKLDEDELDDDAQEDWRFMAKVIDRLSLYVFTILFILTSLFLFLATPRMFDYRPLINLTDEFNQTVPFR
ncbi:hypothetical protein PENTCL1PPCAC_17073 [Pristionchus entomophagus]|uniref:Uncharacterized protein n=1 Tax=Pristionchus entomophagus TaxID=358040 RepID=A0AAV5TKW0_9BILA|nr:hypothetical protein PENTCL1PPCAC_17073 [Pristionchus entomophagus]